MNLQSHPPGEVWPVMLTPFDEQGGIDWSGLDELTDWYVYSGAHGLFAVCYSSEMFHLSVEERLQIAARTTRRAKRIPVIAAGTYADSIEGVADYAARLADTGVAGVVCMTNQFCAQNENDDLWKRGVERLIQLVDPAVRLGLYECPLPTPRLLTPEALGWAAGTGRFHFLKDTSCSMLKIQPKIEALRGSSVRFFNANAVTLLDSLYAGAAGFSGIAANYCPQLYVWLCRNYALEPDVAQRLQRFMTATDHLLHQRYPAAAKQFLALCGLNLRDSCRVPTPAAGEEDLAALRELRDEISAWHQLLGMGPFPHAARARLP
jgi:4-hydroxy-tetrahydrodipicolinate synthase